MAREQNITPRAENFAEWYQDIIAAAELAEHSGVKGSMIIKPYGYAIWERLRDELDARIKATGHRNAYFPLLIPESYLKREKEHIEGFSPELAVVTHAGGEKLEEPLVIRPTSETIIYETYSRWIQSYRDLPMLINQWANVVRWELRPRLFLRTTEFLWQEGHTAHATENEAQEEVQKMLGVYKDVAEKVLAIPVIDGEKTASERFAGAKRTFTIEAMMQDGKALQAGTSHNLGQGFSEAFNVQFTDRDGQRKFVWLTSWGVSTRLIGGLIMTHSDDRGLVLPPNVAPIQVVIVPISKSDEERDQVLAAARALALELELGDRVLVDERDYLTAGAKFNEWERKGVPIRIELGPRDLIAGQLVIVRRDTCEKTTVRRNESAAYVKELLNSLQNDLFARAQAVQQDLMSTVLTYDKLKEQVSRGFARAHWCGNEECEAKVKAETKATIRCLPFERKLDIAGTCAICGGESKVEVIWARAY